MGSNNINDIKPKCNATPQKHKKKNNLKVNKFKYNFILIFLVVGNNALITYL